MNIPHLQETAKHYANLAEQYRTELAEEQQLNEDLLDLVDALCEELGIDVEKLLNEVSHVKDAQLQNPEHRARIAHQAERMRKLILAFNAGKGTQDPQQRGIDAARIASMAGAMGMNVRRGDNRDEIISRQGVTSGEKVTDTTPLSVGGDGEEMRQNSAHLSAYMRRQSQNRRDRLKELGRHNNTTAAANQRWGVNPSTSMISLPKSDIPSHLQSDDAWHQHQRGLRNNPATRKTSSRPLAGEDRTH